MTKLLLDLFCKAGGCTRGYQLAGFKVVGVDIEPQPHYCGNKFVQADAVDVMKRLLAGEEWSGYYLRDFSVIHASPVCKAYTNCNRPNQQSQIERDDYDKLIPVMRELLQVSGAPYVIENVVGAKKDMRANLMLCASMFNLPMERHRLFEIGNIDVFIPAPAPCNHKIVTISVVGGSVWNTKKKGTTRKDGRVRPATTSYLDGHAAMQVDWMTKKEMSQAIPPAYTRYIGEKIIEHMEINKIND